MRDSATVAIGMMLAVSRNTPADDELVGAIWRDLNDRDQWGVVCFLTTAALAYLEQMDVDPGQVLPPILARRATDDGGHG